MRNKRTHTGTVVLSAIVGAAICYGISVLFRNRKTEAAALAAGLQHFREKKYELALTHLLNVQNPNLQVLNAIQECYEALGNNTDALIYLNRCIARQRDPVLIRKRFQLHQCLEMNRKAFKDLFLIDLIKRQQNKETTEFLRKICARLAKTFKIEGFASPANCADFFETLFFLWNIQDPAVALLNGGEYERCYEYVKESTEELHRLIYGCFCMINADIVAAVRIFEGLSSPYSHVLILFIRAQKLSPGEVESLSARIATEEDPTVLFYIARIFKSLDNRGMELEALQRCIEVYPNGCAYCSLIVWHIKQNSHQEAMQAMKLALKTYPESINLVCIALEYYVMNKSLEEAATLLERAEKVFGGDPRIFLFKFILSEALGSPAPEYLYEGIQASPRYFKLHIYLGNFCASGEESIEAYRNALACAMSNEEVFTAYQLLIIVETQTEIFKEYPDLVDKNS